MSSRNEQMQSIWTQYEEAGMPTPATARDVAEWALSRDLWRPKPVDIVGQCAEELSRALREEYRTDRYGRRYRAKHAVKIKVNGVQMSFWADANSARRSHIKKAFAQRRGQIVDDCHQLKIDVDCYNDFHPEDEPIQFVLDFTMDIMEIEAATGGINLG
jgi:hypothetical protein